MSNKLYTKEMFLQAAEKCEVSMIDAKHIITYIDMYVTPIELPTDDEIYDQADINSVSLIYEEGYKAGAKWMRKKIGGSK